ncbi:MAG: hypothetical protein ACK566_06275, partial [Bacteroidota bacterium]
MYTFVVLKFFRNIVCWLLLISITLGYAGIPMHKMICHVDGHTEIALFGKADGCSHENKRAAKKSCCETEKTDDQGSNCCHFEHTYSKIYTDAQANQDVYIKTAVYWQEKVCTLDACIAFILPLIFDYTAKAPPPKFL